MLLRKMLREFKMNFGLFFSVFLLAALAVASFCTFEGNVLSQKTARENYHRECSLSDIWVYGEGFSEENLEMIRSLDFVQAAQLRMSATGSAPDLEGVQVDFYLERENVVNTPYLIEGEAFNPLDREGIWLANAFAKLRNIQVGDDFTIEYNGIRFTREVKGLIESAEYEFRQADGDADMYLENIAIVYMSYDAFPIRDYVVHLIEQEKITAKEVAEETTLLDSSLEAKGMSVADVTQDMLLQLVDKLDDEKLAKIMPYTQIIIRTMDGGALSHEEAIADCLKYEYSAMVDRASVPGLARLDSELSQHQAFSYVFVVIFVGIAVLVIATSMGRMVEKQRTQIGTMNALGMKKSKVLFHYISYSLFVSVLGVVTGLIVGVVWLCPIMTEMFAAWYIVPGLHSVFQPVYLIIAAVIVLVCILATYLSCRKLLKVNPAEALRPAPPKSGKRCLFEKLPFWHKLSFNSQYNLRDVSRAKLRTLMGIVGTAVGMLLMVYGVGCNKLVDTMLELTFEKVTVSDYQIKISTDTKLADADALADELDGELVMVDMVEVAKVKNAGSKDKRKETLTVTEGKGFYNILDLNNEVTHLKPGSVGVSRKLAEDLDIQPGDTIYWHIYSENQYYEATVGVIYRSCETQGITYLREDYEKTGAKYVPTLIMTNNAVTGREQPSFVTAINSKNEMIAAFQESMEVVNVLLVMMVLFSVIMIVVVLFNSGSLSFNERVKEFATLKVMGLQSNQIRRLLSVQNIWLSFIGIFLGAPLGNISLNAMMNSNGENFDYNLKVPFMDYVIAGIFVLVISMLVSFMFTKRIKNLDMVEVLRGVE